MVYLNLRLSIFLLPITYNKNIDYFLNRHTLNMTQKILPDLLRGF